MESTKPGQIRKVRKFLFLPRAFGGITKWLEFAYIIEEYAEHHGYWREIGFGDGQ